MATSEQHSTLPAGGANAAMLRGMVDSTLAFHGLRPHVADQLVGHLSDKVVALELLPPKLRAVAEAIARQGRAP